MSAIDEIIVGITSSVLTAFIIAIVTVYYNRSKLKKEGLKVLMFRNDRVLETHFIPFDSKNFSLKGGQYIIREEKIRSAIIGLDEPKIVNGIVHLDSKNTKLGMREIIFFEGNPEAIGLGIFGYPWNPFFSFVSQILNKQ